MNIVLKTVSFLMVLTMSFTAFAFEIDEQLTVRLLSLSDSKRTVLVNRGLEDGVTVDDHVKFFLTSGVLARGVAIRVAPTRSVWSLYRVVSPDALYEGRAMSMRKTRPVDLTEDRTRDLDLVDRGGAIQVPSTIRLAEGADDLPEGFDASEWSESDRQDFMDLSSSRLETTSSPSGVQNKTWNIYGLLGFTALATTSDLDDGDVQEGNNSNMEFSIGFEKYAPFSGDFFSNISLSLFIHRSFQEVTTVTGSTASVDALGYGAGISYHFFNNPLSFGRFIGYANVSGGVGSSSDKVTFQSGSSTTESDPLDGTFNFLSAGFGMKYYLSNGFGFRGFADFYQRAESYLLEDDSEFTKNLSGPRVQLGLSYRW